MNLLRHLLLFAAAVAAAALNAEVKLAALFSDHVVLQREAINPVWGTARKGETITVAFRGQKVSAKAGRDGRWRADLPAMPANAEPADLLVTGSSSVTVHDVLVGDVWVCSGQSNMEWPLRLSVGGNEAASTAQFPLLRHFRVERVLADAPADDVKGEWVVCTPETAPHFTAVGFFFAREIQSRLGIPIGLLNNTWGGTPVEAWMSPAMLAATPLAAAVADHWKKTVAEYPEKKAAYDRTVAAWEGEAAAAKAAGKPAPDHPWRPAGPGLPEEPSRAWNGMIAPTALYSFRGVIWYQGEGNTGRAAEYRSLFPALIQGWRATLSAGAGPAPRPPFPFLWVQLPNWEVSTPAGTEWAELREAQALAQSLPATGMAVAIDVGDSKSVHPTAKAEVGHRLALLARARVYGEGIDASGPVYATHAVAQGAVRIRFSHSQIGLICHGPRLHGFTVAGADRKFVPAAARIDGDSVVVSSPAVPEPLAVRYAFLNDPQPRPNLYNGAGLPAAPFRTDDW